MQAQFPYTRGDNVFSSCSSFLCCPFRTFLPVLFSFGFCCSFFPLTFLRLAFVTLRAWFPYARENRAFPSLLCPSPETLYMVSTLGTFIPWGLALGISFHFFRLASVTFHTQLPYTREERAAPSLVRASPATLSIPLSLSCFPWESDSGCFSFTFSVPAPSPDTPGSRTLEGTGLPLLLTFSSQVLPTCPLPIFISLLFC